MTDNDNNNSPDAAEAARTNTVEIQGRPAYKIAWLRLDEGGMINLYSPPLAYPVLRLFPTQRGLLHNVGIDPQDVGVEPFYANFYALYAVNPRKLNARGNPYKDVVDLVPVSAGTPDPQQELLAQILEEVRDIRDYLYERVNPTRSQRPAAAASLPQVAVNPEPEKEPSDDPTHPPAKASSGRPEMPARTDGAPLPSRSNGTTNPAATEGSGRTGVPSLKETYQQESRPESPAHNRPFPKVPNEKDQLIAMLGARRYVDCIAALGYEATRERSGEADARRHFVHAVRPRIVPAAVTDEQLATVCRLINDEWDAELPWKPMVVALAYYVNETGNGGKKSEVLLQAQGLYLSLA
jgi:hypothetical protein